MTIRQHYYTSCRHPESARTGFQVKAESPGIARHTRRTLDKLLGYRLPADADPQAVPTHPVSLRYYVTDRDEALLICARSNGADEFGRPGNFFAHSLLGTPEDLSAPAAPIAYWRSPFWVLHDDSEQTTLPELNSLDRTAPVAIPPETALTFLTGQRQEWLYRLLCAVLDYPASGRRIVIADNTDNVARWIALLTLALPPQHRRWLTFATYHHDPYGVPFMITGITPGSAFHFTPDEYRTYFVLNVPEERVSMAPADDYARFICDQFSAGQYESTVQDFYRFAARHDAPPPPNPARLADLSRFYRLDRGEHLLLDTVQVTGAARLVMHNAMQQLTSSEEAAPDIVSDAANDLHHAWDILAGALLETEDLALLPDVIAALERLNTDDVNVARTCERACAIFRLVIRHTGELPEAEAILTALDVLMAAAYPPDKLRQQLNDPLALDTITKKISGSDPAQLQSFWQHYGPHLTIDDSSYPRLAALFTKTCAAAQQASQRDRADVLHPPEDAADMLKAWLRTQRTVGFVTRTVQEFRAAHRGTPLLEWVYYAWVEDTPLEGRVQLRDLYTRTNPQLTSYELQRDLLKLAAAPQDMARCLHDWSEHVHPLDRERVLQEALEFLWTPPLEEAGLDRAALARHLLADPVVLPVLDDEWQIRLLEATSHTLPIAEPDPATLDRYRRLLRQPHTGLSPVLRAALSGSVSLALGELDPVDVSALAERFRNLEPERYRLEAGTLLARFFDPHGSAQTHGYVVGATYAPAHRETFWGLYRGQFYALLLNAGEVKTALDVLDFWFTHSYTQIELHPYLPAEFFILLPGMVADLRAEKAYQQVGPTFEANLQDMPWYPVLRQCMPEEQKARGLFKSLFER